MSKPLTSTIVLFSLIDLIFAESITNYTEVDCEPSTVRFDLYAS